MEDITPRRHDEADFDSFGRKDFVVTNIDLRAEQLVRTLRQALPLSAQGRPSLSVALRRRLPGTGFVPRATVTNVFNVGEDEGYIFRAYVQMAVDELVVVVAQITQFVFNRRHPIAYDIAAYRKRRMETDGITDRGGI